MSLRDYAGHKEDCPKLGKSQARCDGCQHEHPNKTQCAAPVGVECPCLCGLDKAIAEHDAEQQRIAAVVRLAREPFIRSCAKEHAVLQSLFDAIEALENAEHVEEGS